MTDLTLVNSHFHREHAIFVISPSVVWPCLSTKDTKDSYAVLGIAALNHGVCYPAHRHDNQATASC